MKGSRVIILYRLTSAKIYSILISKIQNKPSSNIYFKNLSNYYNIDWTAMYMLLRLVTYNTHMRSFPYIILNNVLFPHEKLQTFGIKPSPLCSFCNLYDKTLFHIFYGCNRFKCLLTDLVQCFQNYLILPTITPQTSIFGILESASKDSIFKNNKIFINTFYLYLKVYSEV